MKVLTESIFKKIKPMKLNRDGKRIGWIVKYKKKLFYYSERHFDHYFIKFKGFGLDRIILRKITIPSKKPEDKLFQLIEGTTPHPVPIGLSSVIYSSTFIPLYFK